MSAINWSHSWLGAPTPDQSPGSDLASDWSVSIILPSDWSVSIILPSDWSVTGLSGSVPGLRSGSGSDKDGITFYTILN